MNYKIDTKLDGMQFVETVRTASQINNGIRNKQILSVKAIYKSAQPKNGIVNLAFM